MSSNSFSCPLLLSLRDRAAENRSRTVAGIKKAQAVAKTAQDYPATATTPGSSPEQALPLRAPSGGLSGTKSALRVASVWARRECQVGLPYARRISDNCHMTIVVSSSSKEIIANPARLIEAMLSGSIIRIPDLDYTIVPTTAIAA